MNDLELALLVEKASHEVAEGLRPRLRELERENDRLLGELRAIRRAEQAAREAERDFRSALVLKDQELARLARAYSEREVLLAETSESAERWAQQLVGAESQLSQAVARQALLERLYTDRQRPKAHDHPTDAGAPPTLVSDLHDTLTPSDGFLALDQPGFMLPPFPGVAENLNRWASEGVCVHIGTGALSPEHDPLTLAARELLVQSWAVAYGLPVGFICGKVTARLYYDDRMVPVIAGNWLDVAPLVEVELEERSEQGKDGIRTLINLPEIGEKTTDWPDPESVAPDKPRGLSTRIFDADMHRTVTEANSSTRDAPMRPGAVECLNQIYDAGYQVHLSCAGWDPMVPTHTPEESARRLASMRMQVRGAGIRYDQFVAKDHGTVFIDNAGLKATDWKKDLPQILRILGQPAPTDEVTTAEGRRAPGRA